MDKYYTPTIEELYVGFKYESKENFQDGTVKSQEQFDNAKWVKEIFGINDNAYVNRSLNGKNSENGRCGIRVKYLDKEDIESLGFIQTIKDQYYKDDFELLIDDDLFIQIIKDDGFVFQGTIKNKSELIILLKQLGINE